MVYNLVNNFDIDFINFLVDYKHMVINVISYSFSYLLGFITIILSMDYNIIIDRVIIIDWVISIEKAISSDLANIHTIIDRVSIAIGLINPKDIMAYSTNTEHPFALVIIQYHHPTVHTLATVQKSSSKDHYPTYTPIKSLYYPGTYHGQNYCPEPTGIDSYSK